MDDHMFDLTDTGDRVMGRLLEAYADDDLSPSVAATTRMRMAVMAAGHRRAALMEADRTFDAAGETTTALAAKRAEQAKLVEAGSRSWRRPIAAVMGGVLTLGILAGTAFAARPGGPLYEARIWTEMANLPAGAADRAAAESDRLDQRLTEAQQAATAGDGLGAEAALVAYSQIVVEAATGTLEDPAAKAMIEVTVTRHVAVLTRMASGGPGPARDAAQQALVSSTAALDHLDGQDPASAPAADPVKTPKPEKTPKPQKTPEPAKTPKPAKAPEPQKTPKPAKTPHPAAPRAP